MLPSLILKVPYKNPQIFIHLLRVKIVIVSSVPIEILVNNKNNKRLFKVYLILCV